MPLRSAVLFTLLAAVACRHGEPADYLLRHGVVYPFAIDSAPAQAVAIRDGRVVYVGTDRRAGDFIGRKTVVFDLKGRMVLPAFRDTHLHPRGGIQLGECPLDDLTTEQAVLDSVSRYAAARVLAKASCSTLRFGGRAL